MSTLTRATNKELTVPQYTFYKRKGMTDEKVMALHGYNTASLNAWKKQNDLVGVKFEKDVKVSQGAVSTSSSVDSKPEIFTALAVEQYENKLDSAESDLQPTRPILSPSDIQTLAQSVKRSETPLNDEYEGALSVGNPQTSQVPLNPINYIDLTAVENGELKAELAALEERHVKDGAELDAMRGKYHAEKTHNARHCDELVAERRKNKELDAQNRNLLAQLKRQDELLVAADRDRKLLFALMEKAVEQNKQIQVAVEGGEY